MRKDYQSDVQKLILSETSISNRNLVLCFKKCPKDHIDAVQYGHHFSMPCVHGFVKVEDILPPVCYCWLVCELCTMAGRGRGEILRGDLESSLLY